VTLPDFSRLFTGPENIFWFMLGIGLTQAWQWIKCKWKDHTDPKGAPHKMKKINWFYVSIVATVAITTFIGVQNQRTYDFATKLANDTRECQIQFNTALRVRGAITQENDKLSRIQRTALADWIHDLIFPPPHIAQLPYDDPGRTEWGLTRTAQADREIRAAQEEQEENDKLRAANPYPDPECGK